MVHGVVALIGHCIDSLTAHQIRQGPEPVEDQVLGPVSEEFLGHGLHRIIPQAGALEGSHPDAGSAAFRIRSQPEHDLVKVQVPPVEHQGQTPFLPLARMKQQVQGQGLVLEFVGPQVHPAVADVDFPEEFRVHPLLKGMDGIGDHLFPFCPAGALVKECPGFLLQ